MSAMEAQCNFCLFVATDSRTIFHHTNLHHSALISGSWLPCGVCNSCFPTIGDLNQHHRDVHLTSDPTGKPSTPVKCNFCSDTFNDKNDFWNHARRVHSNETIKCWISCETCHELFPTPKSVRYHKNHVHNEKAERESERQIMCQFCPKTLRKIKMYIRHANSHHHQEVSDTWLNCPQCDLFLPDERSLAYHKGRHHQDISTPPNRPIQCQFCQQQFMHISGLVQHANTDHYQLVSCSWLPCQTCQIFFPSPNELSAHTLADHQIHFNVQRSLEASRCCFCPFVAPDVDQLCLHANSHHFELVSTQWFRCNSCQIFLPSETSLAEHSRRIHETFRISSSLVQCPFCSRSFESSVMVFNHANQVHYEAISKVWQRCTGCKKYFPTTEALKNHFDLVHVAARISDQKVTARNGNALACQFCQKFFKHLPAFLVHANTAHKDQLRTAWIPCGICDDHFPSWRVLKRHRENVHASTVVRIENFDETINDNWDSGLRSFNSNATGTDRKSEAVFVKPEWNKESSIPGGLLNRSQAEEGSEDEDFDDFSDSSDSDDCPEEVIMNMDPSEIKQEFDADEDASYDDDDGVIEDDDKSSDKDGRQHFRCSKCGKVFGKPEFLKRHVLRIHTVTTKVNCDACGKTFKRLETLHKHKRSVHLRMNRHKCNRCEKCFADNFALTQHIRSVHSNIKYDCELCGKSFTSKGYIKRHRDLVHLKNRNFDCQHCGQAFSENHVLKRHVLAVHLKHRNFECERCGQTFSENHVLKRHIQSVHLKQRNHECDKCGRSFSEGHVLKRHIQSVHLKQRNYSCERCGQTFSENHVLKRHMTAVHGSQTNSERQQQQQRSHQRQQVPLQQFPSLDLFPQHRDPSHQSTQVQVPN